MREDLFPKDTIQSKTLLLWTRGGVTVLKCLREIYDSFVYPQIQHQTFFPLLSHLTNTLCLLSLEPYMNKNYSSLHGNFGRVGNVRQKTQCGEIFEVQEKKYPKYNDAQEKTDHMIDTL